MTPQQKNIITCLALANILVLCLGGVALFYSSNPEGSRAQVDSLVASLRPTRAPTATATRPLPTPTLEAGWKLYPVPNEGFTLALPSAWEKVDLDPKILEAGLKTMKQNNPQVASWLEKSGTQILTARMRFFAVDTTANSVEGNAATNLTVNYHQLPRVVTSFEPYAQETIQEIEKLNGVSKPIYYRNLQLSGVQAAEMRYHFAVKGAKGEAVDQAIIQYVVVREKDSYVLTFGTPSRLESKKFPVFEKIARTWRWTNR